MFPFILRSGAIILYAVLIHVFVLPAGADQAKDIKKKPIRIDFSDVVQDSEDVSNGKDRMEIRIAVAAMISPKSTYQYYIELLNRIGGALGRNVVFIQKKTYAEVNQMIKQNELDLAFVCSGPYVSGKRDFGMEILAVPVCHGQTVYHSYFIVSKSGGIHSFCQLKGKTFAFTDPLSNTGYLVPIYYLVKRNEHPETYFNKTFFTHSHDNSIRAVVDGIADGAAVDSLIFKYMQAKNPGKTDKIRVIEESPAYGIPPVVVPPSIDPALKSSLKTLFLSFHESREGKSILKKLMIDRFVEGNDRAYDSVRGLQDYLNTRLK